MKLEYVAAGAQPELPILLLHGSENDTVYALNNMIRSFVQKSAKQGLINSIPSLSSPNDCKILMQLSDQHEGLFRIGTSYKFEWNLSSKLWAQVHQNLETYLASTDSKKSVKLNSLPCMPIYISNSDELDW